MNLNCEQALRLIEPYRDEELDVVSAMAIEQHLRGCTSCAVLFEAQRSLGAGRRANAPYYRMPEELRARLHAALPAFEASQSSEAPAVAPPRAASARMSIPALRWALPLAAGLVVALGVDWQLGQRRADGALLDSVVASHLRSLQAGHLDDVASTDQHTVKPWFAGRLDYSPPVHDLATQGYPLAGGRLDYLDGRAVAALDYRRRQHIVNVFVWPAAETANSAPIAGERNGYHLLRWHAEGMQWWAVSDLNAAELAEFAKLLRAAAPPKS